MAAISVDAPRRLAQRERRRRASSCSTCSPDGAPVTTCAIRARAGASPPPRGHAARDAQGCTAPPRTPSSMAIAWPCSGTRWARGSRRSRWRSSPVPGHDPLSGSGRELDRKRPLDRSRSTSAPARTSSATARDSICRRRILSSRCRLWAARAPTAALRATGSRATVLMCRGSSTTTSSDHRQRGQPGHGARPRRTRARRQRPGALAVPRWATLLPLGRQVVPCPRSAPDGRTAVVVSTPADGIEDGQRYSSSRVRRAAKCAASSPISTSASDAICSPSRRIRGTSEPGLRTKRNPLSPGV